MSIQKVGKVAIATSDKPSAQVQLPENQRDGNSAGNTVKKKVSTGGKSYDIYPWGINNLLPNEMIELYRSNGDVMNLVQTRVDFMYGSGPGWFRHRMDGKDLILVPYSDNAILEFGELNDVDEQVNTMLTFYGETANSFVNLSKIAGESLYRLNVRDSLTVRAAIATGLQVDTWLLASDWKNVKRAVAVPAWNKEKPDAPETIYQIKSRQSGQFYYGYARWWATKLWIILANRVAPFHNTGLDTEYNVNKICRVHQDFFEKFGGDTPESVAKFKEDWYNAIESLLFGGEGKRKVLFDECTMGVDGKLQPWIEFADIPKQLTGKEYSEIYDTAIRAFANASGILAGLVGVNDGKMLGGSGSELRVTAEYQQFYRTPRDRQAVISFFNRVIKPTLKLPADVHFGFKNILLESLDKAKSGSSQQNTSASTSTPATSKSNATKGKK